MVKTIVLKSFLILAFLETAQLQDCPKKPTVPRKTPGLTRKEVKYAKPLTKKSESWIKEKTIAKRHALRFKASPIIPKHLINDTDSSYTHIIRKEYRQMTSEEMDTFHNCLQKMKDTGDYDDLADLHHPQYAWAAHFGVAFLPWHRQYLLIFEQIIRGYKGCEDFFIPYWDITLDEMLPNPYESELWTDQHFGTANGTVNTGRLGNNWQITKTCIDMDLEPKLLRHTDGKKKHLYSKQKILDLFAANSYTEMLLRDPKLFLFSKFELAHGFVHCYLGTCYPGDACIGHFACLRCSSNDPIFWLLHAFVDYLWDEWAAMDGKENVYPEIGIHNATFDNMGKLDHQGDSPMSPFPGLKNRDGFKQGYYPRYMERPSLLHCERDEDCYSPTDMLFCHRCGYCSAKVRETGNCTGLPDKACYCPNPGGVPMCLGNICHC